MLVMTVTARAPQAAISEGRRTSEQAGDQGRSDPTTLSSCDPVEEDGQRQSGADRGHHLRSVPK